MASCRVDSEKRAGVLVRGLKENTDVMYMVIRKDTRVVCLQIRNVTKHLSRTAQLCKQGTIFSSELQLFLIRNLVCNQITINMILIGI
jgi:hypothetical protein